MKKIAEELDKISLQLDQLATELSNNEIGNISCEIYLISKKLKECEE